MNGVHAAVSTYPHSLRWQLVVFGNRLDLTAPYEGVVKHQYSARNGRFNVRLKQCPYPFHHSKSLNRLRAGLMPLLSEHRPHAKGVLMPGPPPFPSRGINGARNRAGKGGPGESPFGTRSRALCPPRRAAYAKRRALPSRGIEGCGPGAPPAIAVSVQVTLPQCQTNTGLRVCFPRRRTQAALPWRGRFDAGDGGFHACPSTFIKTGVPVLRSAAQFSIKSAVWFCRL